MAGVRGGPPFLLKEGRLLLRKHQRYIMFIGREEELRSLREHYDSDRFEFAVVYGRRRVGKTTLIRRFAGGRKNIYYMAMEGTARENLAGLSGAVLSQPADGPVFRDYSALLDYVDQISRSGERLIFTIDEYPYLAASYPAISSLIQQHIDLCWKEGRLFLILCGSSMSFMEKQVLGYKSPLYGRRTLQCRLRPFTLFEAVPMLSSWSSEDAALLYGVTGGIPEYLDCLNSSLSVDDNLQESFFHPNGRLFEEPVNLLKQELREPASYHSILSAIAGGASRLNEIAQKCGLETSGCSAALQSLIALGIVRKEVPVTEKETSRRTIYSLEDGMFQFWYRFVRPYQGSVAMGMGAVVYNQAVKPHLSDYMGHVFEEICRQYLFLPEVYTSFPFLYAKVGRWWGTNPGLKQQEEVDLVALGENALLLCECKWRKEKVNVNVAQTLLRRGDLFPYAQKAYCIFSKSGFDERTAEYASEHGIRLISYENMLEMP